MRHRLSTFECEWNEPFIIIKKQCKAKHIAMEKQGVKKGKEERKKTRSQSIANCAFAYTTIQTCAMSGFWDQLETCES